MKDGTLEQYQEFVKRISDRIGIGLELDCVFRKFAFPAARGGGWVANKYYGITTGGEIEARGSTTGVPRLSGGNSKPSVAARA